MATGRTDLDLGAVRRHFNPDRRKIEDLALFILHHSMPCKGADNAYSWAPHASRFARRIHRQQRLTVMAWLSTLWLVTSLP